MTKRYGLAALCLLLAGLLLMAVYGSMSSSAKSAAPQQNNGQLVGAQDAAPAGAGAAGAAGSSSGSYGSYGDLTSSPSAGAQPSSDPSSGGQPGGTLAVRNDAKLGSVVTDGQGFTLYRFDKDTAKPPQSNCNGDCAKTWPPVMHEGSIAGAGIDSSLIGEVTRADGSRQLTVGGWPAYRYAKDAAAGDTNGQGVGGTWFALAPDGKKAGAAQTGGSSSAPSASSNYPSAMPTGEAPKPHQSQAPVQVQISIMVHPQVGSIIVDAQGRTLYTYSKDVSWPQMHSNCEGQCTNTWKPAPPVDPSQIKGVDPKLIGKMQRADGTWQLSINCKPVYLYMGDKASGDARGNGMDNQWSAITASGTPAVGK
ncbi:SCO0930 family lipoprotein [Kitasatospora sp. NPDC050543]|uniref:SCO0930 family lipoprotein n=1 Tax=Kitasatospora sp. NPDC050543 TaxID=3364054 RepID=UPI0037A952A8